MNRKLLCGVVVVSLLSLTGGASAQLGPAGWWAEHVGDGADGSVAVSGNTITIIGDGHDIWDNSDGFQYMYKQLTGDGSLTARVVSVGTGSNTWAKGGVMIRQNNTGPSQHAMMVITGSAGNGASFQQRVNNAGGGSNTDAASTIAPPYWVKIVRTGNAFLGSTSPDGKTWTAYGGAVTVTMTDPVLIGLCVTSHAAGQLRTMTFDNISFTGKVTDRPPQVKAWSPDPADGKIGVTMPLFQWKPGETALLHNIYIGTTPNLTEANLVAAKQSFAMVYYVQGLQPGVTHYWRVDEVEADGTVRTGDVWKFTATPAAAWAPKPGDSAAYVATNVVLEWSAGLNATMHDVYFGADRAAVETGAAAAKKATAQPTTTYTPVGLERGKTYYWRVDEAATGGNVAGSVWSFTTRPVIAKVDPNMVGWWKLDDEKNGAAVDYSGSDNYGTIQGAKFVEGTFGDALQFSGAQRVDLPPNLMKSKLGSLACWVKTTQTTIGTIFYGNADASGNGYGGENEVHLNVDTGQARFYIEGGNNDVSVRSPSAINTGDWQHVAVVWNATTVVMYVNGAKVAEAGNTGNDFVAKTQTRMGQPTAAERFYTGLLDDVRLFNKALTAAEVTQTMRGDPLIAWGPQPASGASLDLRDATSLSWSAGEKAAKHDVYFGKDKDAVKAADAKSPLYKGQQAGTSFSLAGLAEFGGGAYFWRVDEVEADGTVHKGSVWTFTIPGYLIVDEFESYNDDVNAKTTIYDTWTDNYDPKGDKSGSVVGNDPAPFAERTIVHSGRQSLPMSYNNAGPKFLFSETVREFSPLQNWTGNGVTDLSLWFRGNPAPFADKGNGAFTVGASGHDIWDNADDFRFVYKSLSGNGSVTVKVESLVNTNGWAKAGVMIRQSLDADSAMAYMIQSVSNGVSFGWRQTIAGTPSSRTQGGITAPQWVKLTRTGNAFTAQYSADGKAWTDIKNADGTVTTTVSMTGNVYIGLCTTSHNAGATTTAEYTGAATTGTVTGQWQQVWIGDDPDRTNNSAALYVAVEDSAGKSAVAINPDPAAVNVTAWTEWKVPLSSLTGVNLAKVKKMYIGVGDRKNPVAGGSGRIYIDDIRVSKP